METLFEPVDYRKEYESRLMDFLAKCLPESGKVLDIEGRHRCYKDVDGFFERFWCMFDGKEMIGAVAVRKLGETDCELKSLYLLEKYHGLGYGRSLLLKALEYAKKMCYEKMYLDAMSTSKKAIALYQKNGFVETERYNDNKHAQVFMVLKLKEEK